MRHNQYVNIKKTKIHDGTSIQIFANFGKIELEIKKFFQGYSVCITK